VKCPKCSAQAPAGAAECPSCGVIFAKLSKKKSHEREADKKAAADFMAMAEAGERSAAVHPWLGKGIAIGLIVAWLGAMGYYLVRAGRPPSRAESGGQAPVPGSVLVRDPATGELKRVPVVVGQGYRQKKRPD
jgi:hypothetical protein